MDFGEEARSVYESDVDWVNVQGLGVKVWLLTGKNKTDNGR